MSSLFSLTFYRLRKIAINYYLIIGLNIIHLYYPISKQSKIQVTLEMLCKQNEVKPANASAGNYYTTGKVLVGFLPHPPSMIVQAVAG